MPNLEQRAGHCQQDIEGSQTRWNGLQGTLVETVAFFGCCMSAGFELVISGVC